MVVSVAVDVVGDADSVGGSGEWEEAWVAVSGVASVKDSVCEAAKGVSEAVEGDVSTDDEVSYSCESW